MIQRAPLWNLLLVAGSCIAGILVPYFYDWTESDQSRMNPLVGWVAIAILVANLLFMVTLGVMHLRGRGRSISQPELKQRTGLRVSIRSILVITGLLAILLGVARQTHLSVAGYGLYAVTMFYVVRQFTMEARYRWPILGMLGCHLGPFSWVLTGKMSDVPFFWLHFLALPGLIPSMLMEEIIQRSRSEDEMFLAPIFAGLGLLIGTVLLQLGIKRWLAFILLLFTCSLFGSFILNALVRM